MTKAGRDEVGVGYPSVRVESVALGDPRFDALGEIAGYSKFEALGRMVILWSACTRLGLYVIRESMIAGYLGQRGVEAILGSDLGERVEGGIRVRGTEGRIEWLAELKKHQIQGGRKRAATAERDSRGRLIARKSAGSSWHPAEPALAGARLDDGRTPAGPADADQLDASWTPAPAVSRSSTSTLTLKAEASPPLDLAPLDLEAPKLSGKARRSDSPRARARSELVAFLAWFNAKNGRSFEPRDQLVAWTEALLRKGFTQDDLRKVAEEKRLEWSGDPAMAKHLVPGTLLRPSNFERYVDVAREAYAKENPGEGVDEIDGMAIPDGPAFDLSLGGPR